MSAAVLRCSLGDLDVQELLLRLPQIGNWIAHIELAWTAPPTGPASLLIYRDDGTADMFSGTIRRSGIFAGSERVSVVLVGGAGRLIEAVLPREHAGGAATIEAGVIARGLSDATGETLVAGVEATLDASRLPRWTRIGSSADVALDLLAEALGLGWRVQADGRLWIGAETWPPVDASGQLVGGDPADGSTFYSTSGGTPLLPGQVIDGVRATIVEYSVMPDRTRVRVGSALSGDAPRIADRSLYRAAYGGRVVKQGGDGTLDVIPDDARLPGLRSVSFKLCIPGARATIPEGSRVKILFAGADPQGAFACDIDSDAAAAKRFALEGGSVVLGTLTVAGAAGAVLTYTPAGGAPSGPATTVTLSGVIGASGQHAYLKGIPS